MPGGEGDSRDLTLASGLCNCRALKLPDVLITLLCLQVIQVFANMKADERLKWFM